jgi:hypothetical protein
VIRDGELTPEEREHQVTLLHSLATAATLAPRAEQHFPGDDAGAWAT